MTAAVCEAVATFLLAPASPRPLAVLRIGIAAFELCLAIQLAPHLLQLYGQLGFVQWPVGELIIFPWLPTVGRLAKLVEPLGVDGATCVRLVFGLYVASLLGLLVGWQSRVAAIAAGLLHQTLLNTGFFSTYGVDLFVHITLFYCAWMPVGADLSLDRRAGRASPRPSWLAGISLRTLQLHLCVVYATAGLSKLGGRDWRDGQAIWESLMQPQFAQFDLSWLSAAPGVLVLLGWTVVASEILYPVLVWPRRTRAVALGAIVGMHAGIAVFLGLWMFSAVMILLNLCAFGWAGRGAPGGISH